MVKLVDTQDLKSCERKFVRVQVPLLVLKPLVNRGFARGFVFSGFCRLRACLGSEFAMGGPEKWRDLQQGLDNSKMMCKFVLLNQQYELVKTRK